ncbi:hypothetical protein MVEN_00684700 [Mycena venus]|uniref:Uncharacterized protein n=1 Tax=Mycena venus TaxID=2733690 RepID=A0A8H6YIG7_9AGAR|nr:hypothetical protein MVEN_00684700 [Mycena venus]
MSTIPPIPPAALGGNSADSGIPSSEPPALQPFKKMTAQAWRAAGLSDDPFHNHAVTVMVPKLAAALDMGALDTSREDWLRNNCVEDAIADLAEYTKGINLSTVREALVTMTINRLNVLLKAKKTRRTDDSDNEETSNAGEIGARTREDVPAEERQRKYIGKHNQNAMAMFQELLVEEKKKHEEEAERRNTKLAAGPTQETIWKNQENIMHHTIDALKSLGGKGWHGHGPITAYASVGFVDKEKRLKAFSVSFGNGKKYFNPSNATKLHEEFEEWSREALGGEIIGDTEGAGAVVAELDASTATAATLQQALVAYMSSASLEQLRGLYDFLSTGAVSDSKTDDADGSNPDDGDASDKSNDGNALDNSDDGGDAPKDFSPPNVQGGEPAPPPPPSPPPSSSSSSSPLPRPLLLPHLASGDENPPRRPRRTAVTIVANARLPERTARQLRR